MQAPVFQMIAECGSPQEVRTCPVTGRSATPNAYAKAPQISVVVRPNSMAITIARTDPSTLAAAFRAQAHSTDPPAEMLSPVPAIALSPVGNGMPMASQSGRGTAAL